MTQLVMFLEEPSARAMLEGLLPRLLPDHVSVQYVVFQGKSDLEKRLPMRLRAWQHPDARFVVLRDQDSGDCHLIKRNLRFKCDDAGKPETLVRIACHELESFYLGDLAAVSASIGPTSAAAQQDRAKFRNPDRLANPTQELKRIAPSYQKIGGSREIGPHLSLEDNRSNSFRVFIDGVRGLFGDLP